MTAIKIVNILNIVLAFICMLMGICLLAANVYAGNVALAIVNVMCVLACPVSVLISVKIIEVENEIESEDEYED